MELVPQMLICIYLYIKRTNRIESIFLAYFQVHIKARYIQKHFKLHTYFNMVMLSSEEDNMAAALFKLLFRKLSVDIH